MVMKCLALCLAHGRRPVYGEYCNYSYFYLGVINSFPFTVSYLPQRYLFFLKYILVSCLYLTSHLLFIQISVEHEKIYERRTCGIEWTHRLLELLLLKAKRPILIDMKRGNSSSSLNLNVMIRSSGPNMSPRSQMKAERQEKRQSAQQRKSSLQERGIYSISMPQRHFHLNSL